MPTITLQTRIEAARETCFDVARDANFHVESARETGERIVAGRAQGLWGLGDEITFEGRHLLVRQRFSARVVALDFPDSFVDEMTRGAFASMRHEHRFEALPGGATRMIDVVKWRSPWGILGRVADCFVDAHLRRFLRLRAQRVRERAELIQVSMT